MSGQKSKIALVKGQDRYQNISAVLELLQPEIAQKIQGKKRILVKPNFVSTTRQLAATHVDTVRAVLDFILPLIDEDAQIIIGEGAALGETQEGFKNFGYTVLLSDYSVIPHPNPPPLKGGGREIRLLDLNQDETKDVEIYDADLNLFKVPISKTVLESDFRISLAIPKTHDSVIITLSLKNMAVGSIAGSAKSSIHQGPRAVNRSLACLAKIIPPHLVIIDGWQGMQGNGPVNGDAVDCRWVMVSLDFLAADCLAARLMGFDWQKIGYLYFAHKLGLGQTDLSQIDILGNVSFQHCQYKFKPHDGLERQLRWQ